MEEELVLAAPSSSPSISASSIPGRKYAAIDVNELDT